MPLPEDWNGVFYDKDSSGDWLFDLSPAEFYETVKDRPDAQFLIAGACFDLFNAGEKDRYRSFMAFATGKWKDKILHFAAIPFIQFFAVEMLRAGADRETVRMAVSNFFTQLFAGLSLYTRQLNAGCPMDIISV
jgi:hypothetical protein